MRHAGDPLALSLDSHNSLDQSLLDDLSILLENPAEDEDSIKSEEVESSLAGKRKSAHLDSAVQDSPAIDTSTATPSLTYYQRRKIRLNILPRILKKDIRRDYSVMYVNAMNSGNGPLIAKFFLTYGIGDCQAVDYVATKIGGTMVRRDKGLQEVSRAFQFVVEEMPDIVGRLVESRIVRRADQSTSSVVITSLVHATKIMRSPEDNSVLISLSFEFTSITTFHLDASHRIVEVISNCKSFKAL